MADKIEKSKVTLHNKSTEGARVVSDVALPGGSVLLAPGASQEVEMSKEGVDHYKAKAEKGGDIQFGKPKEASETPAEQAQKAREEADLVEIAAAQKRAEDHLASATKEAQAATKEATSRASREK